MNTNKTYRFLAGFMALMLFVTTSGLTLDMHFCTGKLKRVNLFGEALSCAEMMTQKSCAHKEASCHNKMYVADHSGCCQNESIDFDLDTDMDLMTFVDVDDQETESIIISDVLLQATNFALKYDRFEKYDPPPLIPDLPILHQSFLL